MIESLWEKIYLDAEISQTEQRLLDPSSDAVPAAVIHYLTNGRLRDAERNRRIHLAAQKEMIHV